MHYVTNQAQALATVEQTKQNAQNVNTAMSNLKQGIANKDTVKASENYHDADADKNKKSSIYKCSVSSGRYYQSNDKSNAYPDEITRALTQVTDAKNGLNGEAKLGNEKQNAKDACKWDDAFKRCSKTSIKRSNRSIA
ncbi:hypothetical protein ACVNPX_02380 [Staphylococcus aureus]